jgi:hypothetical protein
VALLIEDKDSMPQNLANGNSYYLGFCLEFAKKCKTAEQSLFIS